MPETAASLERYLSNGMIKGIGPAIAKRITTMFGEDTLHVLKYEPKKLAQVRGISKKKLQKYAINLMKIGNYGK